MPKLTPTELVLADKVLDAVADGPIYPKGAPSVRRNSRSEEPDVQKKLRKHRLSTDDALETLSNIMHNSPNPGLKLQAAKLALEMDGFIDKENNTQESAPTIQFVFKDSNVNLNGIFNPNR